MALDVKKILRDLPPGELAAVGVAIQRVNEGLGQFSSDDQFRLATAVLAKLIEATSLDIDCSPRPNRSWAEDLQSIRDQYARTLAEDAVAQAESEAEAEIAEWRSASKSEEFGYARFSEDERAKLLKHLENIRMIIDASNLSEKKK